MELDIPYKGIKHCTSPEKLNEVRERIIDYVDILNLLGLPIERFGDQRFLCREKGYVLELGREHFYPRISSIIMDSIPISYPKRKVTVAVMGFGERNKNGRVYSKKTIPYNVLSAMGRRNIELAMVGHIPSFT